MKKVEIISLIYKSTKFLEFINNELIQDYCKVEGFDVSYKIVANDPTSDVKDALCSLNIPHVIYNDPIPNDYYLNRVYRCWNYSAKICEADILCFVNSDMAFSNDWLKNLLKHHDGINIPCSRLVESGRLGLGGNKHTIHENLGRTPDEFDRNRWGKMVDKYKEDKIEDGGLYMPCLFDVKKFNDFGGYPIMKVSDAYLFDDFLKNKYNMKHITVFDSLVYHIQEGEMRS